MAQFVLAGTHTFDGGTVRFIYESAGVAAVEAAVHAYFVWRGYALEEGSSANGVYGKGSAVSRALLGGLATRYKFKVAVGSSEGVVLLDFCKGMSGIVGGALGVSKMTKEFAAIQADLMAL